MHASSPPQVEYQVTPPVTGLPDEVLANQAQIGQARINREAFGELYHRHVKRIYRYHLARTGNAAEAEDLTTQTFLAALEGIHTYRKQRPFSAWLYGIASHKMIDHYRRQRNHISLENAEEYQDSNPSIDEIVLTRLNMEQVSIALRSITAERAEALVWRMFAGLCAAEVGQIMDKSETAVRMLVMRGLEDLRQRLTVPTEVEK